MLNILPLVIAGQVVEYASIGALPASPPDGSIAAVGTDLYVAYNGTWTLVGPGSGSGITALTGDVTASGSGSVPATVVSVGGASAASIATAVSTYVPASRTISTTAPLTGGGDLSTNRTLAMPVSTNSVDGYLSAADHTTFAAKQAALTFGNLTDVGTDGIAVTGGAGAVIGSGTVIAQQKSDATHNGYLSAVDWTTFNSKADNISSNFITNSNAEIDLSGWNLYDNSGNTASAYVIAQDITWTAATPGNPGNGINIEYIYNAGFPSATPNINVISSTHVQVQWNNGPTVANNPTATQLKAAWDAVPSAVAIATATITGTAGHLQYITGSNVTANGGDAAPTTGTGGSPTGVTLTRNTSVPLVGTASFDLGKDAANRQGQGVSTDFAINNADKGQLIQISFYYNASSGMVLGSASDIKMFIYDITNAVLIPISPTALAGPVSTTKTYVATFTAAANSINYRLIYHIATSSAVAWDLIYDNVVGTDIITPGAATQVPRVTVLAQPISGAVTDHMVVMWLDGASAWVPATITGATTTDISCLLGFATNIVGLLADIVTAGSLDGFSFGPFVGYNQYIDNTAGGISPLPSPFIDKYVSVGKGVSSTTLNILFTRHVDAIGVKGGLLTNSGVNDGTGDTVLAVGSNGNVLIANSAAANGIQWAPAVVAAAPFTYTTATRTLTAATATNSVAGFLSAADHTTFASAVTTMAAIGAVPNANGASISAATLTLQPASASFGGIVTTGAQTFAGVKTFPTPIFTGDANASTGNILISTIGKGLQVKTGTNAKIGTAVLVGGTVTVANTSVTANSRIVVTSNTDGGTPGWLRVSAKTAATSFVITSSSGTDTSTVAWMIVESIP